ncbi:hypothetical protein EFO70_04640 [Lacticaseibacillus rhamnosus]|nr:hypothetical protein [Lacticaseibacillus rhamnosus]MCT3180827.1 hypothetical protein [Lacticaseibacillus rhamnosus]
MAGLWPLRPRSLHANPCAGERVMGISQNTNAPTSTSRATTASKPPTHTQPPIQPPLLTESF